MKVLLTFLAGLALLFLSFSTQDVGFPLREVNTPVELGAKLFFDKILSLDQSISCASCHNPKFAFADSTALSEGVGDSLGSRNAPSVMNMASRPYFFYDGRAATLEEQAMGPIENPVEMHLSYASAVERVQQNKEYQLLFNKIYGTAPDSANIIGAIADFERSLESGGSSPFDQWMAGNEAAMTESAKRGHKIFLEKGLCFECHFSPDFTGDEFRNIGLYDGVTLTDRGRFDVTKDSADLGKFKVPGMRNIALTPPYMHDGRFQTLREVIDFYDDFRPFVKNPINIDSLIEKPLHLTEQEKVDLENFLISLTDEVIPYQEVKI